MKISTEKTQSMVLLKHPSCYKLVVEDQIIEQVEKFKYLGIDLFGKRRVLSTNKNMSIGSKLRIYKTCMQSLLIYEHERNNHIQPFYANNYDAESKLTR